MGEVGLRGWGGGCGGHQSASEHELIGLGFREELLNASRFRLLLYFSFPLRLHRRHRRTQPLHNYNVPAVSSAALLSVPRAVFPVHLPPSPRARSRDASCLDRKCLRVS